MNALNIEKNKQVLYSENKSLLNVDVTKSDDFKLNSEDATKNDNNVLYLNLHNTSTNTKDNNEELNNMLLKCSIDEFLQEKRMNSVTTYNSYLSDIRKLAKDLFNYDDYTSLTKDNLELLSVDEFIKYRITQFNSVNELGKRKFANDTINRRFSCYKQLYEYLEARDIIKYNVNKMKSLLKNLPRQSVEIDTFSMEDAERVMEYLKSKKTGLPYYLASKLSIDTGLRAKEILTLQWNMFYPEKETVVIKSKGKIKGKGNKDWEKEISLDLYNEVLQLKKDGTDEVFSIGYSAIAKMIAKAIKELKLDDRDYSFHSFRKCAATNHYELTGGDILSTKDFLNHSNVNTTQKYVKPKNHGMTGIYSLGDNVDKELYKNVDKEILLDAISDIDNGLIHLLNIKINEKLKNMSNKS